MLIFFSSLHVLLCVFMIFVILLQPGKDAGMGAALGGGAATSAFGGRGAVSFLGKVTAVCAMGYFITSLGLSFVGLRTSVTSGVTVTTPAPTPAPADTAPAMPSGTEAPKAEALGGTGTAVPVEAAPAAPAAPAGEAPKAP